MPRGLALPILPGPGGKARMVEDEDEQLTKIIMIGLSDCTSGNPFQKIGLPQSVIFDINDDKSRGLVYDYLERFFARLEREGRAKLTQLEPGNVTNEGESVVNVYYYNIKTRSPKAVGFAFQKDGIVRTVEVN